jgi:hypothetical protein
VGEVTIQLTAVAVVPCNDAIESVGFSVNPLPIILEQPEDAFVEWGKDAVFTVIADHAESYQWYFEGEMIPGADKDTLLLQEVTLADQGEYYVEITNSCNQGIRLVSMTVNLYVLPLSQEILLGGPINGVSTYLNLLNDNVAFNMSEIMNILQYVEFISPNKLFVPTSPSFPWNELQGAKVGISESFPTSINVVGYPTVPKTFNLPAGLHYMPVTTQFDVDASSVFEPIHDQLTVVFTFDYSGIYWPAFNIFTLETLQSGKAYMLLLNSTAPINLDFPATSKAASEYAFLPANKTVWKDVIMTGNQHIIAITTDVLSQLELGDVIGAFNQSGEISGMLEITTKSENTAIRIYGNEPASRMKNGFMDGDVLNLKLYRNGREINLDPVFDEQMPNTNIFAKNGVSAIVGLKADINSIDEFTAHLNVSIYPNPAKDFVNIETNFGIRNLKVVNYVGQVVFDRNIDQVGYQLNTSGFNPGIYLITIQTDEGILVTRRLTIR